MLTSVERSQLSSPSCSHLPRRMNSAQQRRILEVELRFQADGTARSGHTETSSLPNTSVHFFTPRELKETWTILTLTSVAPTDSTTYPRVPSTYFEAVYYSSSRPKSPRPVLSALHGHSQAPLVFFLSGFVPVTGAAVFSRTPGYISLYFIRTRAGVCAPRTRRHPPTKT